MYLVRGCLPVLLHLFAEVFFKLKGNILGK
jgi:hypothetical protein